MSHRSTRWQTIASFVLAAALLGGALLSNRTITYPDFVQEYAAAWGRLHGAAASAPLAEVLARCCSDTVPADPRVPLLQSAHPPIASALALPLALLPFPAARIGWLIVGWLAVLAGWRVARASIGVRLATAILWMTALSMGTVEPLVFAALAGSIVLRERDERWAGVLLGIAAALKVYPAVLIVSAWLAGSRRLAIYATAAVIGCVVVGEIALGSGATLAWLRYMPINTARYVDLLHNLSIPHLVRMLVPGTSALLASVGAILAFGLPLVPRLRRDRVWPAALPVMLLASPLCWSQYLPLATLISTSPIVLWLWGASSIISLLAGMNIHLVPSGLPFFAAAVLLPLIGLLLHWYAQIGRRAPRRRIALALPASISRLRF